MPETRIPRGLFVAIVLAAIVQCIYYFPLLPDRLASHFAASGVANGWMTKSHFFAVYAALILAASFVEFWLPRKIARTPGDGLRLPNKGYWLAPERRKETFAYFERFLAWFGCVFLFVEISTMGLAMRANLETPPQLPTKPILALIVGFVLFNTVSVIAMFRRFSMTE